ncbi:MAG: transporter substrate-binding domain-containing protein [Planctomycetota bacterium]|jgi:L-cystine transport system substrate-binding protein|nr:transporter substrate-binding domain-containing protein [Planctomycetota bacterium]
MKPFWINLFGVLVAALATVFGSAAPAQEVRKITIAFDQTLFPVAYADEDGNVTGCDIEAMKLVDELLPQYEFEFVALDFNSIFAGLQTGKFQIALTDSYWTEDRARRFLFPRNNLGASLIGSYTLNKNGPVKTLSEAAEKGLTLSPLMPGDGLNYVIIEHNRTHPDRQVTLNTIDDPASWRNAFPWVAEGRYGFALTQKFMWDTLVLAEDGAFHDLLGVLTYTDFDTVKTWPVINKDETELAEALNAPLAKLRAEGTLRKLAIQFHGYDTWEFLSDK